MIVEELIKTYDGKPVVDSVSFSLPKGKVTSLIGPNGAGKSTVMGMISRLIARDGGLVEFEGQDIGKWKSKELSKRLAILTQSNHIQMKLTVEELVAFGRFPYSGGRLTEEDKKMIDRAISYMELDEFRERFIDELSGGQRQRIGIARVLASNPGLIIADEPVSMLDVSVRADIINMLIDLSRNQGAAVLFISHDIALTRYISDYIAVMYLGRVVEYGTADDVIKNPQHPYTKALISNCASIDPEEKVQNIAIEGEPPTPLNPGPGCYFEPRCYCACETCRQSYPEKIVMENGHWATCSRINK